MTDDTSYKPPSLDLDVVLSEQIGGHQVQLRDVVLCVPDDVAADHVGITVTASVQATAQGVITADTPERMAVSIDANVVVNASGAVTATEYVTGITIAATYQVTATASGSVGYDSNVFRGAMLDVSSDLQYSKITGTDKQGGFERNKRIDASAVLPSEQSKNIALQYNYLFESNNKLQTSSAFDFETAKKLATSSKQLAEYQIFIAAREQFVYESAKRVSHDNWFGFEAMAARQAQRQFKAEYSELIGYTRSTSSEYGRFAAYKYAVLTETAKLPSWFTDYLPPRLWQTVILKKQDNSITSQPLDVGLCAPKRLNETTILSFDIAPIPITGAGLITAEVNDNPIPQTGVIFVTNSVALNRTDDGREINLFSFNVGIDSNSYCWSFSATIPLSELSKVNTAIEQRIGLDFTCNGNLWRFILDGCDDSVSFGESLLTIKGKSRAMLLANPYAAQRGFKYDTPMSARQIAEDELNRGGVPSGFTLDWNLVDVNGWQVPANTYSYTGRTPINSLQWIAESAGGFINADMSADIIHMLEQYPVPSWEWATQTPLLTLPQSLITSRSRGRINKPSYNGVRVYGERAGSVGALIKRTGTAGGYQPSMVTSDLITENSVARSRGITILSDTGDIGNIAISMPLHSDFGVLKPSTLIGVNDGESWIGMVRGTSISGKLGSNQTLEIEQSLDIERHFDKG